MKKAPGIDKIPPKYSKNYQKRQLCLSRISLILALDWNAYDSFKIYISFKIAQVIMINKPDKDPVEEITSYKPISLLPIISKLFERLLLKRLKPLR